MLPHSGPGVFDPTLVSELSKDYNSNNCVNACGSGLQEETCLKNVTGSLYQPYDSTITLNRKP